MARQFSGVRLRELRIQRHLRREHLALRIDRTATTIMGYELGRRLPTAPMLGALADALGCQVDDLFADVRDGE